MVQSERNVVSAAESGTDRQAWCTSDRPDPTGPGIDHPGALRVHASEQRLVCRKNHFDSCDACPVEYDSMGHTG